MNELKSSEGVIARNVLPFHAIAVIFSSSFRLELTSYHSSHAYSGDWRHSRLFESV
jgi:hypothetical protein